MSLSFNIPIISKRYNFNISFGFFISNSISINTMTYTSYVDMMTIYYSKLTLHSQTPHYYSIHLIYILSEVMDILLFYNASEFKGKVLLYHNLK